MKAPFLSRLFGPRLTICIPAYRAGDFIARTVASAHAQEYRDWKLVIANDGGHDEAAFAPFRGDARIECHHLPGRRGWIGNSNWLIRRVDTPYFAILPHDDEVAPDFYGTLVAMLDATPQASCAYTALRIVHPGKENVLRSRPFHGVRARRIRQVLDASHAGVSYRAVNRRPRRANALTLPRNRHGGVFADSTWMMRQAVLGEMLYCDRPLYTKHFHSANTHTGWARLPPETQLEAWFTHCRQGAVLAQCALPDPAERQQVLEASLARLLVEDPTVAPGYVVKALALAWPEAARGALRDRFAAAVARGLRRYAPLSAVSGR